MYSVPMSLVDFIPVILFGIAAWILQRDLYNKMSKGAYALFCAGTVDVFMAGFLKALYKLLYALGVCDFEVLSKIFFPVQALGFVLAGAGLISVIIWKQGKGRLYAAAPVPAVFSGTMIFVVLMVLGLFCMDFSLCAFAKKMKKPGVIVLFALSFIFCLMMGYLSSKDFTQSYMNWVAEAVNVLGQGMLLLGTIILDKAGFEKFQKETD